MPEIIFHRLADLELSDTAQYYEQESSGLGVAFLDEAERCLRSIAKHPHSAPILSGNIRRRLLRRFPYALLYTVKPDGIRILAVMNLRRRPTYWVGRE
jgi:plasmid stabilization system protein ParE